MADPWPRATNRKQCVTFRLCLGRADYTGVGNSTADDAETTDGKLELLLRLFFLGAIRGIRG